MMTLLARRTFFNSGHALSGLSPETLGIDAPPTCTSRWREGLMGKLSRLGNALYEGDVSIDFVGPQVALVHHLRNHRRCSPSAGLYFKGVNFGIEFEGGVEYKVSAAAGPGHPGQRRQDPHGGRRHRSRRRVLPDREHLGRVDPGADRGAHQRRGRQGQPTPSRGGRRRCRKRHLRHRGRGELGRAGRQARPDRPGRLPRPRGAVHLGLLPRVEDVRRGDRGARPRHRDHDRRLRALRVRGHPGHGHRPAHHPRVLALRHRGRLRQGQGEHQEPEAEPARRTPSWPTSR